MRKRIIDITPFGSVFLVLMIIMVGSGASLPRGLMVSLPATEACDLRSADCSIVASVLINGGAMVNQDSVERNLLKTRLHRIFATRKERVFVRADANLTCQEVARVLDIVLGGDNPAHQSQRQPRHYLGDSLRLSLTFSLTYPDTSCSVHVLCQQMKITSVEADFEFGARNFDGWDTRTPGGCAVPGRPAE